MLRVNCLTQEVRGWKVDVVRLGKVITAFFQACCSKREMQQEEFVTESVKHPIGAPKIELTSGLQVLPKPKLQRPLSDVAY